MTSNKILRIFAELIVEQTKLCEYNGFLQYYTKMKIWHKLISFFYEFDNFGTFAINGYDND